MVYPPPVMSIDRLNDDLALDLHPDDHNAIGLALNDITVRLQADFAVRNQAQSSGSLQNATWTKFPCGNTNYVYGEGLRGDGEGVITDIGGFFLCLGFTEWAKPTSATAGKRRGLGFSNSTTAVPAGDMQGFTVGLTATAQVQTVAIPMYVAAANTRFVLWGYQDSGGSMTLVDRRQVIIRLSQPF